MTPTNPRPAGAPEKMTVLIVDDEPLARGRIRRFLRDTAIVEVTDECSDGIEALETIRRSRPDIVFLDVQMPGRSGGSRSSGCFPRRRGRRSFSQPRTTTLR
jgi:chemotaxis response regulator CheB